MTKTRELTDFERGSIYGLWKGKRHTIREIVEVLGIPKSTISDNIAKCKNTTKLRTGRPQILDERDKREIVKIVKRKRKIAVEEIKDEFNIGKPIEVSTRTVQRALHSKGYFGRVAKKKPFVSEQNRKKRFGWANTRIKWVNEWNYVIFSDESRYEIFNNDSKNWVWRRSDEKYKKECLRPTVQKSKGVMVWGCFCKDRIGPLVLVDGSVNSATYIEILRENLIPFLIQLGPSNYIFQDDNASAHRSQVVNRWKEENMIVTLPWPAQSPDLNPIENIWAELERKIRNYKVKPKNQSELFDALKTEWYNLDINYINRLIYSLPSRIHQVKINKGNPTKY
jgi:transposase